MAQQLRCCSHLLCVRLPGGFRGQAGGQSVIEPQLFLLTGFLKHVVGVPKSFLFEHHYHVGSLNGHILITVTCLTAAEYVTGSRLDIEVSEDSNSLVSGLL